MIILLFNTTSSLYRLTCPSKEAMQAPVCTSGPSFPRARPPPTEPMLPNI